MRLAERYRVTLPVELAEGHGSTRDLSWRGVYFECDRGFGPGEAIEFDVVLPAASARLRCAGRVVRVEQLESKVGVAAAISSYSIEGH